MNPETTIHPLKDNRATLRIKRPNVSCRIYEGGVAGWLEEDHPLAVLRVTDAWGQGEILLDADECRKMATWLTETADAIGARA
jgi:hypothetical protein